jgi:putative transposase
MAESTAIHSPLVRAALARLDKTSQPFFPRTQADKKARVPRLQGRHRWHSFTGKEVGQVGQVGHGVTLESGYLVLSRIGRMAVRREPDGGYAWFSCADVPVRPLPKTAQEPGIDLGSQTIAPLADGARSFSSGWYRQAERALKTAQRRVSRRKKSRHRRPKAVTVLAKAQQARRQRRDFHHRAALQLMRERDVISHQDVQMANVVRTHHLAEAISDAGWSAFLIILAFKAVCAGKRAVAVPPAFTSQTCSGCGVLVSKGLSVRWHACPDGGTSLQRDHTAATNRERRGQNLRGGAGVPASENRASVGL